MLASALVAASGIAMAATATGLAQLLLGHTAIAYAAEQDWFIAAGTRRTVYASRMRGVTCWLLRVAASTGTPP